MYAEVAWVLVSSGTQVQPEIILDPDYLPDYLSVSCDYDKKNLFDMQRKLEPDSTNFFSGFITTI